MLVNKTNKYSINFGANLGAKKLNFSRKDFFVNIPGYGQNIQWADKIKETADTAVVLFRKDTKPEYVLKYVISGVKKANNLGIDLYKKFHTGLLRTFREGWACEKDEIAVVTDYTEGKYKLYKERLNKILKKPLTNHNPEIGMSRPTKFNTILHGAPDQINNSLDHVFKLCNNIFPKYVLNDVKQNDLKEINNTIAEIRWIMAHSTPWHRGSDAISNVFMRSMYKAIGIKSYPIAKGVSLDMEAFCTELNDYKKKFIKYFTKPPEIVE